jgi:HEAT repeat protein
MSLATRLTQAFARVRRRTSGRGRIDLRGADTESLQVLALQSGDVDRIRRVLDPRNTLTHAVAAHVIPLLGVRPVAPDAVRALQAVAEQHAGKLVDTLVDRHQPADVRRRIARVLSACHSQRSVDGLLLGLRDSDRDVRTQCSRALLVVRSHNPDTRIDDGAVREALVSEAATAPVDLALVFTMLALVHPRQPIRSAYRALRKGDAHLRGTALEYLHELLPPDIRAALWPHLTSVTAISSGGTSG